MTFDDTMTRAKKNAELENASITVKNIATVMAFFIGFTSIGCMFSESCESFHVTIFFVMTGICILFALIMRIGLAKIPPPKTNEEIFLWYWNLEIDRILKKKDKELTALLHNQEVAVTIQTNEVAGLIFQANSINGLPTSPAQNNLLEQNGRILDKEQAALFHLSTVAGNTRKRRDRFVEDCSDWRETLAAQQCKIKVIVDAKQINTEPMKSEVFAELEPFMNVWKVETNYQEQAKGIPTCSDSF